MLYLGWCGVDGNGDLTCSRIRFKVIFSSGDALPTIHSVNNKNCGKGFQKEKPLIQISHNKFF